MGIYRVNEMDFIIYSRMYMIELVEGAKWFVIMLNASVLQCTNGVVSI